jgi:hypothetical protein
MYGLEEQPLPLSVMVKILSLIPAPMRSFAAFTIFPIFPMHTARTQDRRQ